MTNLVAIDDSPRFSGREAAALIAGLQYLSALPENADRAAMASLTDKLSRGASAHPSAVAVEGSEPDAALALIRRAVAAGVQIEFDYLDAQGEHWSAGWIRCASNPSTPTGTCAAGTTCARASARSGSTGSAACP